MKPTNYNIGKLRCDECYKNSINNKRSPTPDTDEGNKKPKYNIPEPEDPMEEMELDLLKPNKGKEKQKYSKVKCTNCNREESPTNYINNLGICPKCDRLELIGRAIVCREECNGISTIMNMVNKDKSGKPQLQLIQKKLQIWIDRFGYDLEDEDDRQELRAGQV
ncbi:hypothetical protein RhiirA4_506583 [Rhizophagus irregularis]|uniref:Uncharacterized protein n=1 Tax=Rhizophagus irregularis TaxID=588596 RepID=A0A2I1G7N4_9GLOM|nr:hypothetical protein RhiirA4_506583 [Rhizophagus irregularis]